MIFTEEQIKNAQLIKELRAKGDYKEAANLLRKNQQLNLKAQKAARRERKRFSKSYPTWSNLMSRYMQGSN